MLNPLKIMLIVFTLLSTSDSYSARRGNGGGGNNSSSVALSLASIQSTGSTTADVTIHSDISGLPGNVATIILKLSCQNADGFNCQGAEGCDFDRWYVYNATWSISQGSHDQTFNVYNGWNNPGYPGSSYDGELSCSACVYTILNNGVPTQCYPQPLYFGFSL